MSNPNLSEADKALFMKDMEDMEDDPLSAFGGGTESDKIIRITKEEGQIMEIDPSLIRKNEKNFFHIDEEVDVPAMASQIKMNRYIAPGVAYKSDTDQTGCSDGCKYTLLGGQTRWLALQLINEERKANGESILKFPVKLIDKPKSDEEELLLIMADNQTRSLNSDDKALLVLNMDKVYEAFKEADKLILKRIRELNKNQEFEEAEKLKNQLRLPANAGEKQRKDEWMAEQINRTSAFGKKTSPRVVSRYLKHGRQLMDQSSYITAVSGDEKSLPEDAALPPDIHEFEPMLQDLTGLKTRSNKRSVSLIFYTLADIQKFCNAFKSICHVQDEISTDPDSLDYEEKSVYNTFQAIDRKLNEMLNPEKESENDALEGEENGKTD